MLLFLISNIAAQDFWVLLPDYQKKSIERGLRQNDKGETKPHEEVMKKFKKWLTA